MSVRSFESPDGIAWSVWEVIPGQVSEFRSNFGSHLPRQMAEGWLCFDCGSEKRRLYPLPPNWVNRTETELWFLCRGAEPVRPRAGAAYEATGEDAERAVGSGAMEAEPAGV